MERTQSMQVAQVGQNTRPARRLGVWLMFLVLGLGFAGSGPAAEREAITVDSTAPGAPFAHFWEQTFGSGRAILSLRDSYREDLRAVKAVTAVRYVRFHAILHDEVGVYSEDRHGEP